MKHRIFTTYAQTPIQKITTPTKRFTRDYDEEEETVVPAATLVPEDEALETAVELLNQIRVLLFVIIIIKVVCLIICNKK